MEGDTTWAGKFIDGGAELLIVRLRNLTYTAAGATTRARGGWQQHRLGYAFAGPRHLWRLGPLEGLDGAMFDVPKGVGETHWDDAELLPRAAGPPPL